MSYRVVAVNIKTKARRIIAEGKTEIVAEKIADMAVLRRGVDEEFFTVEEEQS